MESFLEQLRHAITHADSVAKRDATAMDCASDSMADAAAASYLASIAQDSSGGFEESKHLRVAKGGKGGGQFAKKPETLAKEDERDNLDPDAGGGGEEVDTESIVSDMKSWCERHGQSCSDEFIAEQAKKVQEKVKEESNCADWVADMAIHNIRMEKSKSVPIGSSATPEGQAERAWLKKNCKGELRALNDALMNIHFIKQRMSDGYEDVPGHAMQDRGRQEMNKYRMRANAVKNMIRRKGYPEAPHKG